MLCDDVKRRVYFFLDGQLGANNQQDYSQHISLCPECDARTKISVRLRFFFRHRMTSVEAPAHLKRRIERTIRAFSTEWQA
jgi:anti-sigma factor (TIGR02949 family)